MTQPVGPLSAKIMIVGEAPSETEERKGVPFCGASGEELTTMLGEAGINRSSCFITNVCRQRPPRNDIGKYFPTKTQASGAVGVEFLGGKYALPPVQEGLRLLYKEIAQVQPTVILALGNTALWAVTQNWGIKKWRGSILPFDPILEIWSDLDDSVPSRIPQPPCKIIPTYHPAAIMRMWAWRAVSVHDMRKAKAESLFPELRLHNYQFVVRPSFEQVMESLDGMLKMADNGGA